jgi:SsrA-binding protein
MGLATLAAGGGGDRDWYTARVKEGETRSVRPLASNRKARHDYHVLETVEAGMVLDGTEVKSARQGRVQLKDSYVEFRDGEAFLVGAHISAYSHGNRENHEPERARKLLLNRREIDKLAGRTVAKGLTVVPLSVYLRGDRVKVEIALAQGKKLYDKRETEKLRELDREARDAVKAARGSG